MHRLSLLTRFAAAVALSLAFVTSGCVTAKIESQRDGAFNKEITRVYVYSSLRMDDQDLAEAFSRAIESELGLQGIAAVAQVKDPLALDEEDIVTDDVATFAPTVILELTQTEASAVRTSQGPGMGFTQSDKAVYDASLYDLETRKRVWRAQVSTSRDAFMTTQDAAADKLAKKIVAQLVEDGLIG